MVVVASGEPGTPVVCWACRMLAVNNHATINAAPIETLRRVRRLMLILSPSAFCRVSGTHLASFRSFQQVCLEPWRHFERAVLQRTTRHSYAQQWSFSFQSNVVGLASSSGQLGDRSQTTRSGQLRGQTTGRVASGTRCEDVRGMLRHIAFQQVSRTGYRKLCAARE